MTINLFNENCMVGMAGMKDKQYSLAICDPPYSGNDAIGIRNGKSHNAARTDYKLFENVAPPREYFDELRRVSAHQIIWGVNFFDGVGLVGGRIVWNKKAGHKSIFGTCEIAYYSGSMSVGYIEINWNGYWQDDMKNKEKRIHPCQKPVALYEYLLKNYAKPGDTILDTHCGSGSILIACDIMGYSIDAYEIDRDYYLAAKARLERHQLQAVLPLAVHHPEATQSLLEADI